MLRKSMFTNRLEALATQLETEVPEDQFDYGQWVEAAWSIRGRKKDLSCGSKACALGWATTMPMFRDLGLYIGTCKSQALNWMPELKLKRSNKNRPTASIHTIVETLFGEGDDVQDLFMPSQDEYYFTPKDVADKIRNFLNTHVETPTGWRSVVAVNYNAEIH